MKKNGEAGKKTAPKPLFPKFAPVFSRSNIFIKLY